jgi:F-type H+-transporting ATPase subunit c
MRVPERRAASASLSQNFGIKEINHSIVRRKDMEGDIAQMGQFIGAGLAAIGSGAAAIGVGHVAGNFLAGALRNPSAAASQTATLFIGIAFAEALGIFSFLVALLLMFAV